MIHHTPLAGEEQCADGADGPVSEAGTEQPAREGGDAGQQRPGGDHEAGRQDRLVPEAREEEDATEDEGPEAAEEGERAQVGQRHGAVADDGRLDDRVGVPEGAQDEPRAGREGQSEGAEDAPAGPAPVRALDDGGHQAGHGDGQQGGPDEVGLLGVGVPHLVERADAQHECDQGEGQVDEEHPAPAGLDQQPADRGPEGGGRSADGRPQADGRPLALGPKAGSRRPSEVGSMRAPPIACSMRAPTRRSRDGETAHRAEAVVKMARPRRKARLRPARSAQRPAGTRAAANTIV